MNKNNYRNKYKTKSLALASAIQTTSTSKLEYIDSSDPQRSEFIFDRSKDPSFDDIIARFWACQLRVDASTFFNNLRYIKSRLYEEKNAKT